MYHSNWIEFKNAYLKYYGPNEPPAPYQHYFRNVNPQDFEEYKLNPTYASFSKLIKMFKNILLTATRATITAKSDYILDGIIAVGGQATLYYCIHGKHVYCAKVMAKELANIEYEISELIKSNSFEWCTSLLTAICMIDNTESSANHADTAIVIYPLMSFILNKMPPGEVALYLNEFILHLTLAMLTAIRVFELYHKAHCDIKLSNIGYVEDRFVLLDYGSVTKVGDVILFTTEFIALDHEKVASTAYDITCLATALGDIVDAGCSMGCLSKMEYKAAIETNPRIQGSIAQDIILLLLETSMHTTCDVVELFEFVKKSWLPADQWIHFNVE